MKIIIEEFNGGNIVDVQLVEDKEIIYTKQGLTSDQAENAILMLSESHDLAPETKLTCYTFNANEEQTNKAEITLDEFLDI